MPAPAGTSAALADRTTSRRDFEFDDPAFVARFDALNPTQN
jgi:hypothetical protein